MHVTDPVILSPSSSNAVAANSTRSTGWRQRRRLTRSGDVAIQLFVRLAQTPRTRSVKPANYSGIFHFEVVVSGDVAAADNERGGNMPSEDRVARVSAAQELHTERLLKFPNVVGTGNRLQTGARARFGNRVCAAGFVQGKLDPASCPSGQWFHVRSIWRRAHARRRDRRRLRLRGAGHHPLPAGARWVQHRASGPRRRQHSWRLG